MSKLIQCKNCGKIYNSNFKMCPECHIKTPVQKEKVLQIVLPCLIGVFILVMGVLIADEAENTSSNGSTVATGIETSSADSEPEIIYIEISADDLFNAYEDNEIAADEKYTGEYVKVTGIISDINSEDFLTDANILLRVDGSVLGCVQCNFNSADAKALANVKKGQKVTVIGTCGGLSTFNVMVSGCELQ